MKLKISIELNGIDRIVGSIKGSSVDDACFSYVFPYRRAAVH